MILGTRSLTHAAKQRQRFVAGQIFTSIHTPPIQIEIDPAFLYIGNVEFEIKAIAHVDRHVFVDAQKQRVKRMIILQFEGFLDNNYKTYSNLPHHPINLGGETFGHDNYFFSIAVDITTYPGAETDHTLRLTRSRCNAVTGAVTGADLFRRAMVANIGAIDLVQLIPALLAPKLQDKAGRSLRVEQSRVEAIPRPRLRQRLKFGVRQQ